MRKPLIGEFSTIPDALRGSVSLSKAMLLVAVGVALIGIVVALSSDTINHNVQYFIETDGYALQGIRIRSVGKSDVLRAYPRQVEDGETTMFTSRQDSVLRDTSLPFNEGFE